MRVLIACEASGRVRDAFRRRGHQAYSCDLRACEADPAWHLQADVLTVLEDNWDLMIAHPDCRYLAGSGLHWNTRRQGRAALTAEALEFVRRLFAAPIPRIAVENPVGCISTQIMPPTQIVQPYQFGDDASKATCLWLKNLRPLQPTSYVPPRIVKGRPRWANQTDSGQNRLGPSPDRWRLRSMTYPGIAEAMAEQWNG